MTLPATRGRRTTTDAAGRVPRWVPLASTLAAAALLALPRPAATQQGEAGGDAVPADFYLDGAPVEDMSVNDFQPEEILALEVYQDGEAPARFRSMRGCGAVAIWLGHGAD